MSAKDFYTFLKTQMVNSHLDEEHLTKLWNEWSTKEKVLSVYTDGAVKDNKNANKKSLIGGIGVYSSDYGYSVSESFSDASNNKAELKAILKALTLLEKEESKPTIIWTDSVYSIKCCTTWYQKWEQNDWKTSKGCDVLNQDLIKDVLSKLKNMKHVSLKYVKGHNGDYGNEKADQLANNAL